MKRTFLVIALFTVFAFAANAQVSFRLGLKGGLNFSNVDTKAALGETYKSSTGYHFGAFSTIKITKFAVQPEVLFSKQGSVIKDITGSEDEYDFSYINIPVLFKLYLAGGLNLQVGPQFGLLTSAALNAADGSETDIKNTLKGSDISLCFGAGIDLPFKLNADVRYVLGVSDVNDLAGATDALKNKVIQVSLGYRFIDKGN